MSAKPRSSLRTGLIALSTLAASASILMGLSSGAFMGLTTSPASNLVNCTQCHAYENGAGGVELVGAPVRYRPGAVYDFSVRIRDGEQFGAGFELSAESTGGHAGTFLMLCDGGTADGEVCITDLDCPGGACFDVDGTQYAGSLDYVTHTRAGVDASFAGWAAGGGSYDYRARWRAPDSDVGPVTFYASGLAVNGGGPAGDHYYFGHATSAFAHTADVDGDTDVGLSDHAIAAGCLAGPETSVGVECLAADTNGDGDVDLLDMAEFQTFFSGDVATLPAAFVLADAVRGGRLYDKWWLEGGVPEPLFDPPGTNHPLYPVSGGASGSATFRCKECHGWDYKGRDGAYGAGSTHFTGIPGVDLTAATPEALFALLTSPDTAANGHDMTTFGMTDRDVWDVIKFVLTGLVDTDAYIDAGGGFIGSDLSGGGLYDQLCVTCHGADGRLIDFDPPPGAGEFVDTVAKDNPWEFLHKLRFGHPDSGMPPLEVLAGTAQDAADVGRFVQTTLP